MRLILVTGANGFLGSALVDRLLAGGDRVRALVRDPKKIAERSGLELAVGDVRDEASLRAALEGADAVVHLAAAKNDEQESEAINVGGARNLVGAMRGAGVRRVINVSTQSAKLPRLGAYGRTKKAADDVFAGSGLDVTTLYPSLLYGDAVSGVFGSLVRFSKLPFIPVFGSGDAPFAPLHREDLAEVIARILPDDRFIGRSFDVGGPENVPFTTLIRRILAAQDLSRPILRIPGWIGLLGARVLSALPHPPVTVSNVLGSVQPLPVDGLPLFRELGIAPRTLQQGLHEIFGTPEERGADAEAAALLRYVLSAFRAAPAPTAAEIARYCEAVTALAMPDHRLDSSVVRSRGKLARLDAWTRLRHPHAVLRKKLLIAAAIRECDPSSAPFLLPKDRSRLGILLRCARYGLRSVITTLRALPLPLFPAYLQRNAGLR